MNTLADEIRDLRSESLRQIEILSSEGSVPEFKKEFVSTVVRLCGKILVADGKFSADESEFLNILTYTSDSYDDNSSYARFCEQKWDWFSTHLPSFIEAARRFDQLRNGTTAPFLINRIERLGMLAAASNIDLSQKEISVLTSYVNILRGGLGKKSEAVLEEESKLIATKFFQENVAAPNIRSELPAKGRTKELKSPQPVLTLEALLAELNTLVGLAKVKESVSTTINLVRINKLRQDRGMKASPVSLHLVFTGNPGTGKTTVARLVAKIYQAVGVLKMGQMIETDRSGLVGAYLGQTALKVQELVKRSLGGMLFIDEAYSLTPPADDRDSYGREAVDSLLKLMEDHRAELIVVVAGYTDKMRNFIDSNPGLRSRFNIYLEFEDYSPQELYDVFVHFCSQNGLTYDEEMGKTVYSLFQRIHESKTKNFANARTVRNIFEKAIASQANRLAKLASPTDEDLTRLITCDLPPFDAT